MNYEQGKSQKDNKDIKLRNINGLIFVFYPQSKGSTTHKLTINRANF